MRKVYEYGGKITQEYDRVDLSQISFYRFVEQHINKDALDEEVYEKLNLLLLEIAKNNAVEDINFSDARLVYFFVQLLMKNPNASNGLGETEYYLVYRYLILFYDKEVPRIDELIRFMNLFIGYAFINNHSLNQQEVDELNDLFEKTFGLGTTNPNFSKMYADVLPSVVADTIINNFVPFQVGESIVPIDETPTDIIQDVQEVILEDEIQAEEEEQIDEMKKEMSEEDVAVVAEWTETIATLNELLKENPTKEEEEEWNMVIETLMELIKEVQDKYMALGGMTKTKTSKFMKLAYKVAKNYKGKKVPRKYQYLYGKRYDKDEALEVGKKVSAKVYRQQLN
jgi:hypothetical protein